jgi:hypothetical protein
MSSIHSHHSTASFTNREYFGDPGPASQGSTADDDTKIDTVSINVSNTRGKTTDTLLAMTLEAKDIAWRQEKEIERLHKLLYSVKVVHATTLQKHTRRYLAQKSIAISTKSMMKAVLFTQAWYRMKKGQRIFNRIKFFLQPMLEYMEGGDYHSDEADGTFADIGVIVDTGMGRTTGIGG